jgi:ubiquinone/menaquinone biosynthesis C-methylase UbiE
MNDLGWPEPLAKKVPRTLLCGTASPYTTIAFVRFVRAHNIMASINILDISSYSLNQSEHLLKMSRDIDNTNISFVEGNALNMPFADGYFDWIETDFFLQYFSSNERIALFKEWYRVLKPEGIVTTRDWLRQKDNFLEDLVERTKNWLIRHILGAVACSAGLQDVKRTLNALDFEVAFFPVKIPIVHIRIPMMSYILIYKPSTNLPVKRLDHP